MVAMETTTVMKILISIFREFSNFLFLTTLKTLIISVIPREGEKSEVFPKDLQGPKFLCKTSVGLFSVIKGICEICLLERQ